MKELKYSIIYAVIRPEIAERISIGIIMFDGDDIRIRYSDTKLKALELLLKPKEFHFISNTVKSLESNHIISSEAEIDYLSRYSNNRIAISRLRTINIEPTAMHKDLLFEKYVNS